MTICEHRWLKVHEQSVVAGSFPVGWQCERCNKFVGTSELSPAGLSGVVTKKHRLVGAHGGHVVGASGKVSKAQVYDEETKTLTYED